MHLLCQYFDFRQILDESRESAVVRPSLRHKWKFSTNAYSRKGVCDQIWLLAVRAAGAGTNLWWCAALGAGRLLGNWGIRMSGPKGISYALQQEVLERLRRREESLADLRAADSRLHGLITRCDDLGLSHIVAASLRAGTQQPGEETPTDVITARAVSVRKSVEGLAKQLEDTLALDRRRSLSASLGALAAQLPSSAGADTQEVTVGKPAEVIAEPSRGHDINADAGDKRARVEEVLAALENAGRRPGCPCKCRDHCQTPPP